MQEGWSVFISLKIRRYLKVFMHIYNCFISEIMFEFIPFCPFSSNNLDDQHPSISQSLLKRQSQNTQSDSDFIQNASQTQIGAGSIKQDYKRRGSANHNMVKQLIITIKQIVGKSVRQLSSGKINKAVVEIWEKIIDPRHTNKEVLKALFDETMNMKLINKYEFNNVIDRHGIEIFKEAIEALRCQILYQMKSENIKSHLLDRRVQNKERLSAFILYFLREELAKGKIAFRQGQRATEKIQKILRKSREQQVFIDNFLSLSEEVIERFASINNEIS